MIKVDPNNQDDFLNFLNQHLNKCIEVLERGGAIVFPTETLYGLGVDIRNDTAIDKLIELKGRPKNMPIAVAVANLSQAMEIAEITEIVKKFIIENMPKPITILLPVKHNINKKLTCGSSLIGLRFPDEPVAKAILEHFGPITATSANIHGGASPVEITYAIEQLGDQIELYIDTGPTKFCGPSTVIDISGDTIKIIRDGVFVGAKEELEKYFRRR